ncbi:hypothetical protein TNCV_4616581 [Trichonephila clavipes]|nr:hypothetical protein TNCV_4616581 [Trichonephila clavipes]
MGVGGLGSDVVDVFEEMEGKSCVWAEDDVVTAVGIFVLCLDDSGASNFKGGHFILVMFSSVCDCNGYW